ncbi:hypothetical protein METBIDRAFT_13768 [Metschnikowia bicuspidata var. bicuspidata NRRL YB-4993]|uniref:G-patch domain-containing protein n=1 Tax=Metschnikowia bicuspidata var. bicuspidata NRRL YB-4993 TaxID=869754 RepID=A0A1A0H4K7_9ASCO|nr:hypothetical protein METBIDRAFT_13768 [Metschnikowia bicuspidata var. bicuspidata NRRL YB-4993]OBA19009.1 hypothetical protein METBIDRAFT_13768 [Metschnikowia bicuspidata var. bicuspidata NRRL YB-4993]
MKNVFGDSSDSEPELLAPPPKKFRPPTQNILCNESGLIGATKGQSIDEENASDSVSVKKVSDPSDLGSDSDFDNIDQELGLSRPGLGFQLKATPYNQKASLDHSIIDKTSIGYQIMEKMGYKQGQAIGMTNNPNALKEPLAIKSKLSRAGLGVSTFTPKRAADLSPESKSALQTASKNKHIERSNKAMILKLQKFCYAYSGEDMKLEDGTLFPEDVNPLWKDLAIRNSTPSCRTKLFGESFRARSSASEPNSPSSIKDVDTSQATEGQLMQLLQYTRVNFYYCPYCGTKFDDEEDLSSNCPGETEQLHQL